jgi:hypothetical protein
MIIKKNKKMSGENTMGTTSAQQPELIRGGGGGKKRLNRSLVQLGLVKFPNSLFAKKPLRFCQEIEALG